MKKLDMTDYVPTEVDVPKLEIDFCDVVIIEQKPMTEEEYKALCDKLYAGELRDLAHLRGIR
jgi:hypothetical protein